MFLKISLLHFNEEQGTIKFIAQFLPLHMCSADQQQKYHLGACLKFKISGSIPEPLNQNLHFNKILKFEKHQAS